MNKITFPELSLVVLIGPSGCGKSTFARNHFKPTEVISSDFCRGLVSDDENNQAATKDAFEVLHFIAAKRLAAGKLTVIDATNVQPEARKPLVELARSYHTIPVAIVLGHLGYMRTDRGVDNAGFQALLATPGQARTLDRDDLRRGENDAVVGGTSAACRG